MILLLFLGIAIAQEVQYKETTEVDFEELEIDGVLVKPKGILLQERTGADFNPLIQLRLDFNEEMSCSVKNVQ